MAVIRVPPAVLVTGAALAQIVLTRNTHHSPTSKAGACALAAASAGLLLSSVWAFRREGTTVDPVAVDRAASLVTTGAFGLSRNPMYVGMAGALLAHAAFRRSWVACVPVGIFVALIDRAQIPAEEQALRETFESAFDDYARRVPRWLGIRRQSGPGGGGA